VRFRELRWDPIVLHGREARRTARHFGLVEPEELAEILVQRYPPGATIGWHRDAPAFDIVVGISLGGSARLRFQRGKGEQRRVFEVALEPRSGYVLSGAARSSWQHSIPATKELRYSITFRTLRRKG
jgi:alkylated DNA repair dioxygenase AlkB